MKQGPGRTSLRMGSHRAGSQTGTLPPLGRAPLSPQRNPKAPKGLCRLWLPLQPRTQLGRETARSGPGAIGLCGSDVDPQITRAPWACPHLYRIKCFVY